MIGIFGTRPSRRSTETVAGIVKLATQAETDAGTDDTRAVTPLKLTTFSGLALLPRSYLAGFTLSNNGTDAVNDIDIAHGAARDADDNVNLVLSSIIAKRIDASWVAGTGNGGLSSSLTLTNDTWYHAFAILVGGSVDVGFDTHIAAANLVADHVATAYRRIGSVRRGTATNLAFVQTGDLFYFDSLIGDIDVTNPGSGDVSRTLTVPSGLIVEAIFNVQIEDTAGGTNAVLFSSLDTQNELPSLSAAPSGNVGQVLTSEDWFGELRVLTNTASAIRSRFSNGTVVKLRISTRGWIDRRGRDD